MKMGSAAAACRVTGCLLMALALTPTAHAAGVGLRAGDSSGYSKLPLTFEENRGQTDSRVKYISRGGGYTLFLTPTETVLSLTGLDRNHQSVSTSLRMSFAGARAATPRGVEAQASRSSYFFGSDRSEWRTNVRHFGRVSYKGLYPGVDAVFYGNQRQMEYDFVVAPGADPNQIRLKFDGVQRLAVAPTGDLVLRTAVGDFRQLRPVIYQEIQGQRRKVDGRYRVEGSEVSFEIASYDRRKPLVIDPVLAWSTFLGGNGTDAVDALAVDGNSNVIAVGYTASADFNAALRFIGVSRGGTSDAFITKYSPAGNSIVWSAFYGGQGLDEALGVAVDAENSVYITGRTDTLNINGIGFPLVNPIQSTLGSAGSTDAFVAKISADASTLVFSTYLGGFGEDRGNDIAVDADKQPVIVGTTASTNFWATRPFGAFNGGALDAFATKLNASGNGLVWSTYLGGSAADVGSAVAVDTTGAAYVTGSTKSFSFPRTAGVVQGAIGSQNVNGQFIDDAFALKISPTGTLVYSTFLGGVAFDEGVSIAVDTAFNAYIFGNTESPNFPTANAIQGANQGNRDTFVTKLNPTATVRVYSTFLGGLGSELAGDIAVRDGVAYLAGSTNSTNFPLVGAIQIANAGDYDVFVTQINAAGTGLVSSTYLGGADTDVATSLALDASNNIYIGGSTESFNYPSIGGVQASFTGVQDGFVTKLSNCTVTLTPTRNGAPGFLHTYEAQPGIITVTGASDCTWNPQVNVSWITLTGASATAGNGTIGYIITRNNNAPRTGIITIAGVQYTVEQQGAPLASGCIYPIEPNSIIAAASGVLGNFVLGTTSNTCAWTAVSNVPWVQVYPTSGTNTATISYTVYPNFSNRVRTGTVTITGPGSTQTFTVTQANSFLSETQRFVALLYFNYLGRYPSQAEIDFQTAVLNSGQTRAGMAASFFNAPEFQMGGRFVAGLYVGLLNRDPEFGGWLFQRNAMSVGSVTPDQLVTNFINSPEFALKYGTLTNEAFVGLLYQQILGRGASQDEINFHAGYINAGILSRAQVAAGFLNSQEFRIRLASRLSAFLLYATLLQRDPTSAELFSRQVQLEAGTPIATLTDQFISSVEFQQQLQ